MMPELKLRTEWGAPTDLLSASEAALLLGTTPELLYAYAIRGVCLGHGPTRRLVHSSRGGRDGFVRQDLEDFDAFLRQPWVKEDGGRPEIPTCVVDYLKVESGGACARCGKGHKIVNAHIVPYSDSHSHHHHNLIRLCTDCHEAFDTKVLVRTEAMLELKAKLVAEVRSRLLKGGVLGAGGAGRMPNPAPQFVGREEEVAEVIEALQANRTVSIEGPAGIGKTQLAITALTRLGGDRRVIWINVEAHRTVEELRTALAAALSGSAQGIWAGTLEDALADQDVHIVFDGVEQMAPADMDDLEDFLQGLIRSTSGPRFLFTSQARLLTLDIDARITVRPISAAAGRLILESALGTVREEPERTAFRWLDSFCAGHPLTLRITVGLLQYFGSASAVAQRIKREQAIGVRNPTRRRQTRQTSLPVCLSVSYETLTSSQRRLLFLASRCPAGYIVGLLAGPDSQLAYTEEEDHAALSRWHLVDVDRSVAPWTRLHVLSPIRAFVMQRWVDENPGGRMDLEYELTKRLSIQAHILDQRCTRGEDVVFGLLRFDMEFANYVECLRLASAEDAEPRFRELAASLASSLMVYCFVRGLAEQGTMILQRGVNAALRAGLVEPASELLIRLISLAERVPDLTTIQAATTQLEEIADRSTKPVHQANGAYARATLAFHEGRLDDAIQESRAAAEIYTEYSHSLRVDGGRCEEDGQPGRGWAEHMLAMVTMLLGYACMQAKRYSEALACYEDALRLIDEDDDRINRGSILHQIGNCTSYLGQMERAFASYVKAAECFEAIEMEEYISNSLGELGYLLVEWDPPSPPDSVVETDLLILGLEDVARQTLRTFPHTETPLPDGSVPTIRKLLGLVALASFTSRNEMLADWAEDITAEIVEPLKEQLFGGQRERIDAYPILHLDLTLLLAKTVARVSQPDGIGATAMEQEVEALAWVCYQFDEPGWRCFRPFDWLSTYLRRHRDTPVSATALFQAAQTAKRTGKFNIPTTQ